MRERKEEQQNHGRNASMSPRIIRREKEEANIFVQIHNKLSLDP